jgi:CheY-like chemotaxis protein
MAHILLVDDDHALVAANAEAIETLGHSVSCTATPAEAAEAVKHRTPDLVVLEAVFGGKFTGVALAQTLAETYPDLPMIMLTRADEQLTSEQLASQDHDEGWVPVRRYLEKPVLSDVLTYEIEHLLPADQ